MNPTLSVEKKKDCDENSNYPANGTLHRLQFLLSGVRSAGAIGIVSGAALATVMGVLIEVPVMLKLVKICLKTTHWFRQSEIITAAEQI